MKTDKEMMDAQYASLIGNHLTAEVAFFLAVLASEVRTLQGEVLELKITAMTAKETPDGEG